LQTSTITSARTDFIAPKLHDFRSLLRECFLLIGKFLLRVDLFGGRATLHDNKDRAAFKACKQKGNVSDIRPAGLCQRVGH
jgi:hypothetical protein